MTRERQRAHGYTIVEIMVVCVVAIVVMGMLLDMFITILQRTNDGRIRVDMQQRAIFAINTFEEDIERTSQNNLNITPGDPFRVMMQLAVAVNSNGGVNMDPNIVTWSYKKAEHELEREVSGRSQLMCDNVWDFSLTARNGTADTPLPNNSEQPLIFKLMLRRTLSTSQRVANFTVERRYALRNTF